jgi:hypothetical protein
MGSRHDLDRSKLVKVVIESKRYFDAELFHDDFACAVGEAPTLIVELLKCFPRNVKSATVILCISARAS